MNAALLLAASALVAGLPAPSAGLLSNPQQHWGFDGPELVFLTWALMLTGVLEGSRAK